MGKIGEKLKSVFTGEYEFKICFIDGNSLKYKEYDCKARNFDEFLDKFNGVYGQSFDHQFLTIFKNGECIFNRYDDDKE